MRPIIISYVLTAASANNIALSQTPGSATNMTINGALASGGVATLDTQRVVLITSAGNDTGITFTVYGTDGNGNSISEAVTGSNGSTASSTYMFKTVTRIATSGAAAAAVTVGTSGVGATNPVILDQHVSPFNVALTVEMTGTGNYTVQYTADDLVGPVPAPLTAGAAVWTNHPNLTAKTATADGNLAYPACAVRMLVNSGTITFKFIIRQAGMWG